MTRPSIESDLRRWIVVALGLVLTVGCARTGRRPPGVPVESRPTPPQPDESAGRDSAARVEPPAPPHAPGDRTSQISRLVSDTTEVHAKLARCRGRKLLPDQEGVYDATAKALLDTRAALEAGDLPRAQSLARQARSLAASLDCR